MAQLTPQEKEIAAKAITKAIGFAENGGKPNIKNPSAGKSGEMKSIFQYTPNTWHAVAAKYLGNANEPLTPDNETTATMARISHWLDQGYNAKQIASMWNAGEGKPNAYKENWKGTNEYGVAYDTPKYADTVNNYAKQFYEELQAQSAPQEQQSSDQQANAQQPQESQNPEQAPTQTLSSQGLMPQLVSDIPQY